MKTRAKTDQRPENPARNHRITDAIHSAREADWCTKRAGGRQTV